MAKHFSDATWADFARNVLEPGTNMTMQQHIDAGCARCSEVLRTWRGVYSIARAEAALTPPADTVRVVKSQFAVAEPQASPGLRLLFDSRLEPLAAGVRGSVAAHQFLYETDEYYIDLRIAPLRETDHATVVGQVLERTGKRQTAQGLTVLLQVGGRQLAATSTNQFGEFEFEFDAANSLSISVGRDRSDSIVLPLYGIQVKATDERGLD